MELAQAIAKFRDPFQLAPRLRIKRVPEGRNTREKVGYGTLEPMREEQLQLFEALQNYNRVYVLKCRRVGVTTAVMAYLFAAAYGTSKANPRTIMSVGHAEYAVKAMRRMIAEMHRGLPGPLRCALHPDNQQETGFSHNGSLMMRELAGGSGEGRSGGLTDAHFTEAAFYPKGRTPAQGRNRPVGQGDKETYQSIMNSMDDPNGKVILESTGNGPRGFFYDMQGTARESENWATLFFPWHHFRKYSEPFVKRTPDGDLVEDEEAAARFAADLTDFEQEMMKEHSLSLSQVRWMRNKLVDDDYELKQFLRDFPFTELDPFLLDESGWFDQQALRSHMSVALGKDNADQVQVMVDQHGNGPGRYDEKRDYYMSVDTSGGVGRDDTVIKIFNDQQAECLSWYSNTTAPYVAASIIASLGAAWGKPLCLIEANKHGKQIIDRVRGLGGVHLFHDADSKDGNFWMLGQGSSSKRRVYDHAREQINKEYCVIHHKPTIHQARDIVETPTGNLVAETGKDDMIDAYCLGLWCMRGQRIRRGRMGTERSNHRQRMDLIRQGWGRGHGLRL